MNSRFHIEAQNDSSLWITNLVNGVAGMTMKVKSALFSGSSPLQKIEVFDTYGFGRILSLAGTVMFTERDEYIYHEMISHPVLCTHKAPHTVCIIGGGDGGCLTQVLKYKSVKKVIVVEIDALVTKTARTYFPRLAEGFSDKRVSLVTDDGYHYLTKCKDKFDVVIVDSYDPGGPVQSLETEDFFKILHQRLTEKGKAVIQTDSPILKSTLLKHVVAQVSSLFAHYRYYYCAIPSFPEGICGFVICSKASDAAQTVQASQAATVAENCLYYNPEIHQAAFCLPQYIKQLLK